MLRRPVRGWPGDDVERSCSVERELVLVARADPDRPSIRCPGDVVGEEGRSYEPDEPRTARSRHVDDRDLLRLRAERDPQSPAARVDGDVPRAGADMLASDDATAENVHRDHLAALCVGDEGVASVGVAGGVARLAEAVQDVRHRQRRGSDERHQADLRVCDHRRAPDRLDAPWLRLRGEVAVHAAAREVDGDQPRLQIRGHQRERTARRSRERSGRERERGGAEEECPPVHASPTRGAPAEVLHTG